MMNALPANALKLLVLFGFLLITLDLLLVRWLKLSKFAWKRIEYIWLGTVALGLISASAEVRNWLAAQQAQTAKLRAETQFSLLRSWAGEVSPQATYAENLLEPSVLLIILMKFKLSTISFANGINNYW